MPDLPKDREPNKETLRRAMHPDFKLRDKPEPKVEDDEESGRSNDEEENRGADVP